MRSGGGGGVWSAFPVLASAFALLVMVSDRAVAAQIRNTSPGVTQHVNTGENATLVCSYTGVDPGTAFSLTFAYYKTTIWVYRGNSTHASEDSAVASSSFTHHERLERVDRGHEQFNMTLQLTNVTLDMQYDYYRCKVGNAWSQYFKVIVSSAPKNIEMVKGKDYVWCTVGEVKPAGDATVMLMNHTQVIASNSRVTGNSIKESSNRYHPVFTRYDHQQDWLYCNVTWRGQVFIAHAPRFDVKFEPLSATIASNASRPTPAGQQKRVTCVVGSSFPASATTVVWKIGPRALQDSDNASAVTALVAGAWGGQEVVSVLTLGGVDRAWQGQDLTCQPYYDGEELATVRASTTLNVTYPANEIAIHSFQTPVYEGDFLLLSCQASGGNPESYTFTWGHRKAGVDDWEEVAGRHGEHLLISSVTAAAHSGTYRCTASNHGGSARAEVQVQVLYPPKLQTPTILYSNPGDYVKAELDVRAFPTPVILNCSMDNTKHVVFLNGTEQQENTTVGIFTGYGFMNSSVDRFSLTLELRHVYGVVTCLLSNGVQPGTPFEILSKPYSMPGPPINLTVSEITASSFTAHWTPGENGGHHQSFVITIRSSSLSEPYTVRSENQSVTVHDLEKNTMYDVSVVAENQLGSSEPVTLAVTTHELEPSGQSGVPQTNTTAVIAVAVALSLVVVMCLVVMAILVMRLRRKNPDPVNKTVEHMAVSREASSAQYEDIQEINGNGMMMHPKPKSVRLHRSSEAALGDQSAQYYDYVSAVHHRASPNSPPLPPPELKTTTANSDATHQTLQTPQNALQTPQNALQTPQNSLQTPQSALQTPQNALQTPQNALQTPQNALQTPQNALQTPQNALQTPQTALQTAMTDQDTTTSVSHSVHAGRNETNVATDTDPNKAIYAKATEVKRAEVKSANGPKTKHAAQSRKHAAKGKPVISTKPKTPTSPQRKGNRKREQAGTDEVCDYYNVKPAHGAAPHSVPVAPSEHQAIYDEVYVPEVSGARKVVGPTSRTSYVAVYLREGEAESDTDTD